MAPLFVRLDIVQLPVSVHVQPLSIVTAALSLTACDLNFQVDLDTDSNGQSTTVTTGELKVYYLDVGQGDSELLFLPDGTTILIDSGDSSIDSDKCFGKWL